MMSHCVAGTSTFANAIVRAAPTSSIVRLRGSATVSMSVTRKNTQKMAQMNQNGDTGTMCHRYQGVLKGSFTPGHRSVGRRGACR